jgi:unsaturated rhamnogalacturonyl hydrolase
MFKKNVFLFIGLICFCWHSSFGLTEFDADSIVNVMKRVAKYRMTYSDIGHLYNNPQANKGDQENKYNGNYPDNPGNNWDVGAFMTGLMAMYYTSKDTAYLNFAKRWATFFNWSPFNGYTSPNNLTTNADHYCCGQTYCEIYLLAPQPSDTFMIRPVSNALKNMFDVLKPSPRILYGTWGWCDALYMCPPTIARYCKAVNNNRLLDSLTRWWDDITVYLYDNSYHMFFRDNNYRTRTCPNGKPMFWSCGEAWVLGGLARVIEYLPADYQYRIKFVTQFKDMCAAALAQQGFNNDFDGLWTTSMLDHPDYPGFETSGSAFFCFAYLWGVRNKLLDSATYTTAANKAWSALVKNIGTDGRLKYCQRVGEAPAGSMSGDVNNSSPEGEGAFLLAGYEMYLRAKGASAVLPTASIVKKIAEAICVRGSMITLRLENPWAASLKIYSADGRLVADLSGKLRSLKSGTANLSLNTLAMTPGAYAVVFNNGKVKVSQPLAFVR